jgi:hypothetical protein
MKMTTQISSFVCVLLFQWTVTHVYSQPAVLKIAPILYSFGNYNLILEKPISVHWSYQFGGSIVKIKSNKMSGIEGGFRYYTRSSLKGFYLYPHMLFFREIVDDKPIKYLLSSTSLGYQFPLLKSINIDVGVNCGYILSTNSNNLDKFIYLPQLRVGYAL